MRILADANISHYTVQRLNALGHDAVYALDLLSPTADDRSIVNTAVAENRVILTQDLDFTNLIALSGAAQPSLISLRLSDSREANVNRALESVLPDLEERVAGGIIATVEDARFRIRRLPVH